MFTIRSEKDLKVLTEDVPRVLLILADYPNFAQEDFETLRFQSFEIQFYLCNPILTFSCTVNKASTQPKISINYYLEPHVNREEIESILMPLNLLYSDEKQPIQNYLNLENSHYLPELIDEKTRNILPLIKINKGFTTKTSYARPSNKKK